MKNHNIELGEELLPYLHKSVDFNQFIYYYVTTLAEKGSHKAASILEDTIPEISNYDIKMQKDIIGSLISYYMQRDLEGRGIELLSNYLEVEKELTDIDRAFFLNQKTRLLYGVEKYEDSEKIFVEILKLVPNDRSYLTNYMKTLAKLKKNEAAGEIAEKVFYYSNEQNKYDADHLDDIIRILKQSGKDAKAQEVLLKLKEINPLKYSLLV
jgi:tetratricopeptide (TPR) repeat protein